MADIKDIVRIIEGKRNRLEHLSNPDVWHLTTKNMEGGELRELKQSCRDDEIIIEILEKQIPKKPLNKTMEYNGDYGDCPCCGRCVSDFDNLKQCPDCGQVLNWKG